jgi:hypothetical protein
LRAYLDSATMHGWLEEVRKLHRQGLRGRAHNRPHSVDRH